MRIVVNDIAASGGGGGRTMLESFHRYVRDHDVENEWIFLLGSDLLDKSTRIRTIVLPEVKNSWLRRLVFDFVTGRRLIRSLKPDVVFSMQNTGTWGVDCPQVVYVHQPLPFQETKNFSLLRRDEHRLAVYQHLIGAIIKQSVRRADHVIVQTRWMRDAVVRQVGVAADRVTRVLPDLDDLSDYASDGTRDARAFFYPTAESLYKNNDCIYSACRVLRQQGVLDFKVTLTIDSPHLRDPNVDAIGRLPREQVLSMISRSTLVFPSYIETYGLPLAEARALGAIVLAADLPYAREVLDGYANAHFFDPASPDQLASLMTQVIAGLITRRSSCRPGEPPVRAVGTDAWARVIQVIERCARAGGLDR